MPANTQETEKLRPLVKAETRRPSLMRITNGKEKEVFIENLSLLFASGMDALSALGAMKEEAKSRAMKETIAGIQADVEGGTSLSKALENSGLFAGNVLSLIKIGEESGKLSENLKVVATQLDKERTYRNRITSAMTYPVFVLGLTVIIGISMAWLVLPRLAVVFTELKLNLPWITKALLAMGTFLGNYGTVFVPSFILVTFALIYFIWFFPKTKFIGQEILLRFPGVAELVREVELARFGYILGSLLDAGLPVVSAFDSLIEVTSTRSYQRFYSSLKDQIEEGNSFQKSFAASSRTARYLPPSVQQMIVAAEQSGFLSETLLKIGTRFEEKTEITTKNLSTLLEPVLLVIVWFGVAGVAIAIILPIYSLVGGFTTAAGQSNPTTPSAPTAVLTASPSPTPTASPSATPKKQIQVLETDIGYLNVREAASKTAKILGRALPGDKYDNLGVDGEWYQITFKEQTGFVNAAYVKELP